MLKVGSFFDLGQAEKVGDICIRNAGDEIAFDLAHSDGYRYTVTIRRVQDNLFKGVAENQPGGDLAEVTCRVFQGEPDDTILLVGSGWRYPGDPTNYPWFVQLQTE
ncbi:hypothetical protein [Pseudomonas sp. PDM19]|uniref:hypothetical protein n=1 Tax=Pseudomonas sp. PDM19 TaxID=2769272 RepID=UPI00177CC6C7|nr:hypothetical protein [Pseudomonas sp. PDM19]MBD9634631.1 hypothetical protein [Pseudomonas sp. PDM19]